ncbi:hypothetical protein [Celeribacter litoreus]|uniref:hypothetical protein n=1 Tax=Celeribacter litoreus TaxID=2876714 RepID=UPI001CCDB2D1|nr:hypothetical protein [Celeribacter litoreus]MCA0044602.1 hypothetical protein [Celeribacter litoreus]
MPLDALKQLEKVKNLYLADFRMGRMDERRLTAIFDEGIPGEPGPAGTGSSVVDDMLGPVSIIEVRPGSRRFTLRFDEYVSFKITDESQIRPGENETYASLFRENPSAVFLRHVQKDLLSMEDNIALHHYCVVALNHVLEVVTPLPPDVECQVLSADDLKS